MKLEVGMYVRSKINGTIGKITEIENIEVLNEKREVLIRGEKRYILDNNYNRGFCDTEKDSVIASHNIIDLIEENDLVTLTSKHCERDVYRVEGKYEEYISLDTLGDGTMIIENSKDIKSIVTKEQFEAMQYKVVEEC